MVDLDRGITVDGSRMTGKVLFAGSTIFAQLRQQPGCDKRANDSNNDVTHQPKAAALDGDASQLSLRRSVRSERL
jgi:hypothetical protein